MPCFFRVFTVFFAIFIKVRRVFRTFLPCFSPVPINRARKYVTRLCEINELSLTLRQDRSLCYC